MSSNALSCCNFVSGFARIGMSIVACAVPVVLTINASASPAPASNNLVKVGKFTKIAVGVVSEINTGDAACYIAIKDDKGQMFDESADFSLCEKPNSYLGKRVAFVYALDNVMADECGGNILCKKTAQIALIKSMKVLAAAPDATPATPATITGKRQTSFCTPLETVVFACQTSMKMVSVCASKSATQNSGYLQYRFGKPDSRDALELVWPEGEIVASKAATGQNEAFAGGGGSWLRFNKGAFSYVVYDGIGRWGPNGETRTKSGLVVERDNKVIAHLKCSAGPSGELGPEWFEKMAVKPAGNEEFLFPD